MDKTLMVRSLLISNPQMVNSYLNSCRSSGILPSCSGFEKYHGLRLDNDYLGFSRKGITSFLREWFSAMR